MMGALTTRITRSTPVGPTAAAARRSGGGGWEGSGAASSRRLHLGTEQGRQAFEVEDPADQIRLLTDAVQAAPAKAAQPVPVFTLAEQLFDLLPRALGQPVAEAARPHPHPRMRRLSPASVYRDVRLDPALQQCLDEACGEEALVPAQGRR